MRKAFVVMIAACVMALGVVPVQATDIDDEIRKQPGFVDFAELGKLGHEAKVEVFLKGPMLELLSGFLKNEEPELYDIVNKLKLVRVLVFETDDIGDRMADFSKRTSEEMDKKGWERIVKVREDGERVDIYCLPSKDYEWINGIVVMVIDGGDEAVFVNIVGELRPDEIGKLGAHFDIDELEGEFNW